MSNPISPPFPSTPTTQPSALVSLLAAIPDSALVPINRDPGRIAMAALAVAQTLAPHAAALASVFPGDPDPPATLARLARALFEIDSTCRSERADAAAPSRPHESLRAHATAAFTQRARLRAAVITLEAWGKLPRDTSAAYGRSKKVVSALSEIRAMVGLLRDHIADVEALTPFRASDLDAAADAASESVVTISRTRYERAHHRDSLRDDRRRVYTALIRHYTMLRAAVMIVRTAERDADVLVPPLCRR